MTVLYQQLPRVHPLAVVYFCPFYVLVCDLPGILQRLQWLHLITWYRYIFRTFVGIRGAAVGISLPRRNPPCIIPAIYYVYVSWYVAYIALNPLLMAH